MVKKSNIRDYYNVFEKVFSDRGSFSGRSSDYDNIDYLYNRITSYQDEINNLFFSSSEEYKTLFNYLKSIQANYSVISADDIFSHVVEAVNSLAVKIGLKSIVNDKEAGVKSIVVKALSPTIAFISPPGYGKTHQINYTLETLLKNKTIAGYVSYDIMGHNGLTSPFGVTSLVGSDVQLKESNYAFLGRVGEVFDNDIMDYFKYLDKDINKTEIDQAKKKAIYEIYKTNNSLGLLATKILHKDKLDSVDYELLLRIYKHFVQVVRAMNYVISYGFYLSDGVFYPENKEKVIELEKIISLSAVSLIVSLVVSRAIHHIRDRFDYMRLVLLIVMDSLFDYYFRLNNRSIERLRKAFSVVISNIKESLNNSDNTNIVYALTNVFGFPISVIDRKGSTSREEKESQSVSNNCFGCGVKNIYDVVFSVIRQSENSQKSRKIEVDKDIITQERRCELFDKIVGILNTIAQNRGSGSEAVVSKEDVCQLDYKISNYVLLRFPITRVDSFAIFSDLLESNQLTYVDEMYSKKKKRNIYVSIDDLEKNSNKAKVQKRYYSYDDRKENILISKYNDNAKKGIYISEVFKNGLNYIISNSEFNVQPETIPEYSYLYEDDKLILRKKSIGKSREEIFADIVSKSIVVLSYMDEVYRDSGVDINETIQAYFDNIQGLKTADKHKTKLLNIFPWPVQEVLEKARMHYREYVKQGEQGGVKMQPPIYVIFLDEFFHLFSGDNAEVIAKIWDGLANRMSEFPPNVLIILAGNAPTSALFQKLMQGDSNVQISADSMKAFFARVSLKIIEPDLKYIFDNEYMEVMQELYDSIRNKTFDVDLNKLSEINPKYDTKQFYEIKKQYNKALRMIYLGEIYNFYDTVYQKRKNLARKTKESRQEDYDFLGLLVRILSSENTIESYKKSNRTKVISKIFEEIIKDIKEIEINIKSNLAKSVENPRIKNSTNEFLKELIKYNILIGDYINAQFAALFIPVSFYNAYLDIMSFIAKVTDDLKKFIENLKLTDKKMSISSIRPNYIFSNFSMQDGFMYIANKIKTGLFSEIKIENQAQLELFINFYLTFVTIRYVSNLNYINEKIINNLAASYEALNENNYKEPVIMLRDIARGDLKEESFIQGTNYMLNYNFRYDGIDYGIGLYNISNSSEFNYYKSLDVDILPLVRIENASNKENIAKAAQVVFKMFYRRFYDQNDRSSKAILSYISKIISYNRSQRDITTYIATAQKTLMGYYYTIFKVLYITEKLKKSILNNSNLTNEERKAIEEYINSFAQNKEYLIGNPEEERWYDITSKVSLLNFTSHKDYYMTEELYNFLYLYGDTKKAEKKLYGNVTIEEAIKNGDVNISSVEDKNSFAHIISTLPLLSSAIKADSITEVIKYLAKIIGSMKGAVDYALVIKNVEDLLAEISEATPDFNKIISKYSLDLSKYNFKSNANNFYNSVILSEINNIELNKFNINKLLPFISTDKNVKYNEFLQAMLSDKQKFMNVWNKFMGIVRKLSSINDNEVLDTTLMSKDLIKGLDMALDLVGEIYSFVSKEGNEELKIKIYNYYFDLYNLYLVHYLGLKAKEDFSDYDSLEKFVLSEANVIKPGIEDVKDNAIHNLLKDIKKHLSSNENNPFDISGSIYYEVIKNKGFINFLKKLGFSGESNEVVTIYIAHIYIMAYIKFVLDKKLTKVSKEQVYQNIISIIPDDSYNIFDQLLQTFTIENRISYYKNQILLIDAIEDYEKNNERYVLYPGKLFYVEKDNSYMLSMVYYLPPLVRNRFSKNISQYAVAEDSADVILVKTSMIDKINSHDYYKYFFAGDSQILGFLINYIIFSLANKFEDTFYVETKFISYAIMLGYYFETNSLDEIEKRIDALLDKDKLDIYKELIAVKHMHPFLAGVFFELYKLIPNDVMVKSAIEKIKSEYSNVENYMKYKGKMNLDDLSKRSMEVIKQIISISGDRNIVKYSKLYSNSEDYDIFKKYIPKILNIFDVIFLESNSVSEESNETTNAYDRQ